MLKSLLASTLSLVFLLGGTMLFSAQVESAPPTIPLPPDTGARAATVATTTTTQAPDYPSQLSIPSVSINAPIVQVGINAMGEMDVPDGRTKNVGWYKYGTVPGDIGSAVIDAHVYAAFNKLRYLKVGGDIYVTTDAGKTLHFKVTDSRVYTLNEVPLQQLFNQNDGRHLNLITCAGKFSSALNTYDHRLIVYATLVEN